MNHNPNSRFLMVLILLGLMSVAISVFAEHDRDEDELGFDFKELQKAYSYKWTPTRPSSIRTVPADQDDDYYDYQYYGEEEPVEELVVYTPTEDIAEYIRIITKQAKDSVNGEPEWVIEACMEKAGWMRED